MLWLVFILYMKVKKRNSWITILNKQILWLVFILYMKGKKKKRNSWMKIMNKQILWLDFILYMKVKERNSWMEKMNKRKHRRISRYIWNKLNVCDSDITFFVQIRLAQQWSSFSRMMLWWSDCSASITVLIQLCSNVKNLYMMKKKSLSKLLRQLSN